MFFQNFEESLLNSSSADEKKSKHMCSQFLEKYAVGITVEARSKADSALLDLPQTLVLRSAKFKEQGVDWREMNAFSLKQLFG